MIRIGPIVAAVSIGLTIVLTAFIVSACGSGKKVAPAVPAESHILACDSGFCATDTGETGSSDTKLPPATEKTQVSLKDVLLELEELSPPDGVDTKTFQHLKDTLALTLRRSQANASAKFTSRPPLGEVNKVTDLACIYVSEGNYELRWTYKNIGDYDLSGKVEISDITPLAEHFFDAVEPLIDAFPHSIDIL